MRFIYVDEAGISKEEPYTVVVGVIANADRHVNSAEKLALEAIGGIPPELRDGFVFSAKHILSGYRDFDNVWSLTDRLQLLDNFMSIPRRIGMSLSVAKVQRGAVKVSAEQRINGHKITQDQFDLFLANWYCLVQADKGIRINAAPEEVAMVIAERQDVMKKFVQFIPLQTRFDGGLFYSPYQLKETASDKDAGFKDQLGDMRITRIRNSIHFVEKNEDIMVQIADACAYGVRRNLAGGSHDERFANAIMGNEGVSKLRNFREESTHTSVWWHPKDIHDVETELSFGESAIYD